MPERRHEPTRLEGFSDAVFAFALTLLVVSLEVPKTLPELLETVWQFPGFALMFAMVCWIWWEHNKFFRNYGLQDAWTAFLNSVLLFVILFYVYPLKFLTTTMIRQFHEGSSHGDIGDGRLVMLLYSSGVVMIFGTFVLLYRHAWRKRADLHLSPVGEVELTYGQRSHVISMSLGVLSMALALLVPPRLMWIPGLTYMLMGPLQTWNGVRSGRARATLAKASAASHAQR